MDKEKVVYIQDRILYSHNKDMTVPFEITWMDLQGIMLSEINQTEKDKYHRISLVCGSKQTNKNKDP